MGLLRYQEGVTKMRKLGYDSATLDGKISEDDKFLVAKDAVIASEIIHQYGDGMAYKPADELEKAAWTFDGRWVTVLKHPETRTIQRSTDVHGKLENVRFVKDLLEAKTQRPCRRGIRADIKWYKDRVPAELQEKIRSGAMRDVSIGFLFDQDDSPGEWNGQKYDYVQRNIFGDHLAAPVEAGRCPGPVCGIGFDTFAGDPWEVTEEYIRSGHKAPGEPCRTIVLSEEQGIKAVTCKYGDTWDIQSYLFVKDKWDLEKAKAWFKAHKGDSKPPAGADAMSLADVTKKIEDLQTKLNDLQSKREVKLKAPDPESEKAYQEQEALREEIRAWQQAKVSLIVKEATGDCGLCDEAEKIGLKTAMRRLNVAIVAYGGDALAIMREEAKPEPEKKKEKPVVSEDTDNLIRANKSAMDQARMVLSSIFE